jgi:hypothetical protein
MPTSARKIAANRTNAQKSTGPHDTRWTRQNAVTHGLCSTGLTDLDDKKLHLATLSDLVREKIPIGVLENFLVETIAFEMVLALRAHRLQGEYITSVLHPVQHKKDLFKDLDFQFNGEITDPGVPAAICPAAVEHIVTQHERYSTGIFNRLHRALNSLERVQRLRQGENVSAPVAVDVSVHAVTQESDHVPSQQPTPEAIEGATAAAPPPVEVSNGSTEIVDLSSAESEPQAVLPTDEENFEAPAADQERAEMDSGETPWISEGQSGATWNGR